jgi:CheY-like chemotaxis protein
MFIADFLDEAGFKIIEAVNADEAVTILTARPDIQALITDIEMPKGSMSGLELAHVVQERWPGIGIVITSGRERPGPEDLSDKVAFVAKPFLPDTIIALIQNMVVPQVVDSIAVKRA